jgi:hypothetical protein
MRRFMISAIALSLAAAPAALEAQAAPRTERPQAGARAGGIGNPAARVLQHRDALGLTLDQVRQLQQLQAQYADRNQPLLDQLRSVRPAMGLRGELTDEQRAELRQRRQGMRDGGRHATPEARAEFEALRPVMEQLRANHVQAREQVQALLSAEQTARLQELTIRRGERPRGEGMRRGEGVRRGAGSRR